MLGRAWLGVGTFFHLILLPSLNIWISVCYLFAACYMANSSFICQNQRFLQRIGLDNKKNFKRRNEKKKGDL